MKLGIIGTGYVGLVQGAGLAHIFNHDVMLMDSNIDRIANLKKGIIPIHEPGLEEWVKLAHAKSKIYNDTETPQTPEDNGRLFFTDSLGEVVGFSDIIFICVGTPSNEDGSVDISSLKQLREDMWKLKLTDKIIIVKSTVPPGTTYELFKDFFNGKDISYLGMNPEFLKEGYACEDFTNPDRIIIGYLQNPKTQLVFEWEKIYNAQPYYCSLEDAELTKYASNAFLAMKVSYAHEIQNIAIGVGANYNQVLKLVGLDGRIGNKFLKPGIGWSGYCWPKDLKGLENIAIKAGVDPVMIIATQERNEQQIYNISKYAIEWIKKLDLRHIGLLGTAFKENTDDIRNSAAIKVIKNIKSALPSLAYIIHDPQAIANTAKEKLDIILTRNLEDTALCDGYIILTPWEQYQSFSQNATKPILDLRNYIIGHRNIKYYGDKL